jgi:hypothetical protein
MRLPKKHITPGRFALAVTALLLLVTASGCSTDRPDETSSATDVADGASGQDGLSTDVATDVTIGADVATELEGEDQLVWYLSHSLIATATLRSTSTTRFQVEIEESGHGGILMFTDRPYKYYEAIAATELVEDKLDWDVEGRPVLLSALAPREAIPDEHCVGTRPMCPIIVLGELRRVTMEAGMLSYDITPLIAIEGIIPEAGTKLETMTLIGGAKHGINADVAETDTDAEAFAYVYYQNVASGDLTLSQSNGELSAQLIFETPSKPYTFSADTGFLDNVDAAKATTTSMNHKEFVALWTSGETFAESPPNTLFHYEDHKSGQQVSLLVTITDATHDQVTGTMTYTGTVLESSQPGMDQGQHRFNKGAFFVDGWRTKSKPVRRIRCYADTGFSTAFWTEGLANIYDAADSFTYSVDTDDDGMVTTFKGWVYPKKLANAFEDSSFADTYNCDFKAKPLTNAQNGDHAEPLTSCSCDEDGNPALLYLADPNEAYVCSEATHSYVCTATSELCEPAYHWVDGTCALAACPDDSSDAPACSCDEGYLGALSWDADTVIWAGTCALVTCPTDASGAPVCSCEGKYQGTLSWDLVDGWEGNCEEAPCPDGASGAPDCACDDGYSGSLTWDDDTNAWTGSCDLAGCPANGSGAPNCECTTGYSNDHQALEWTGTEWAGTCKLKECPDNAAGAPNCACNDWYTGWTSWDGEQWHGDCSLGECPDNASGAPDCACDDGYDGWTSWDGYFWHGDCQIAECPANASGAPDCACDDGHSGSLTWNSDANAWTGSCDLADCPPNGSGAPNCECATGYSNDYQALERTGTEWPGTCELKECPDNAAGAPNCACNDWYTGWTSWDGDQWHGDCSLGECPDNASGAPDCACDDGYDGWTSWDGNFWHGDCQPD